MGRVRSLLVTGRFDRLWARTQREIPGARIVLRKDSTFLAVVFGALGWLLKVVTFGKKKIDYSAFATTIGRTLYMPDGYLWWDDVEKYRRLRHELVHLRQFRCWPFPFLGHRGVWRINAVLMGLCYLLVLPAFLTMRAHFERAGYTQTMLVRWEMGGLRSTRDRERHIAWLVRTFSTGKYFWMSTAKRTKKWASTTMLQIMDGEICNDRDDVDAPQQS